MWQTRRVASWFLLGLTASLVELGLLRLLYEVLQWPLLLATFTAAEALILVKFVVADRWIFGHRIPTLGRLFRYHGASLGAVIVYLIVINGLTLIVGVPYVAAFIIGTGAAFTWSLLTNFLWVWAQPLRSSPSMDPPPDRAAASNERRLTTVLAITGAYMLAEVVGGLLTGSLALVADSGHMLGDVLGLGMAVAAIRFARRPATAGKTYGFYRTEILAALVNGALLIVIATWIVFAAWQRLTTPTVEIQALPMFLVASGGLAVTLVGVALLHAGAHESLNVKAAFLEVVGDLLGSLGTMLAAVVILVTGWIAADALISAVIGLFMLPRAFGLLRSVVDVLLESTPRHLNVPEIEAAMESVPGVGSVHDLHLWSITSGFDAMSGHVRSNGRRPEDLLHDLRMLLRDRFGIEHVTLQVEGADHADDGACCIADPRCFVPTAIPLPATAARSRTAPAK
jgi:cobalt-zinc-cadmium efflux system protein